MVSNKEFVTDVGNRFDNKLRMHAQESATDLGAIYRRLLHLTP